MDGWIISFLIALTLAGKHHNMLYVFHDHVSVSVTTLLLHYYNMNTAHVNILERRLLHGWHRIDWWVI
jgi:hypothetical protein